MKTEAKTRNRQTISEWGKRHGLSVHAAAKFLKAHGIVREADGLIDSIKADKVRATELNVDRQANSLGRKSADLVLIDGLGAAQLERVRGQVLYQNMKNSQLSGRLLDRALVEQAAFARGREEREAWENWPSRVSGNLASELAVDEVKLRAVLTRELKAHLGERAELEGESLLEKASGLPIVAQKRGKEGKNNGSNNSGNAKSREARSQPGNAARAEELIKEKAKK